jgi:hypothetical protein
VVGPAERGLHAPPPREAREGASGLLRRGSLACWLLFSNTNPTMYGSHEFNEVWEFIHLNFGSLSSEYRSRFLCNRRMGEKIGVLT